MPLPAEQRLFLSYARKDGAALAQRLLKGLKKQGFDGWLDTQRLTGGAVWSEEIEREIKTRQVVIALLSPGSYTSEICRAERLLALDKGKLVIPVLAAKAADRPLYLYARQYRDFSEDCNYELSLGELITDIRGDATATLPDEYRKTRVTYLTAPPRVANYLERPDALRALRDALFAEDHRQPIALTALAGMGGIGKTVLAKALTDDEVVQRAFPDGIVWITAGKERKRDFVEEMREVAKALGDDLSGYDTPLACENQYRTTIASWAALIVVDDVWSKADIEPLLAESSRSRLLFTTRDASIGRFVGAREHRADLLDVAQSRELLASWAKVPVAQLPATTDEIIHECGRLPLALSVVGAMLRDTESAFWRDTLDLLRKADLSAIQEQLPEGQESFFKAVEVSFQSLKPEMQKRYKALVVLLEDMAAPLSILQTLWNVNEAEARRSSRQLVDRSLAQRDGTAEGIRLHDLQLDYVRAQYPDKEALDLIHGAIRLSSNVIANDSGQFASQMVGRLLLHQDKPAIAEFSERTARGAQAPWIRAVQPALHPPGTSLVRTLEGHKDWVWGVALSGDGRRAVSASSDKTLKVWELASGRELRTLTGHTSWVTAVAVTPDGQRAVSASHDKTLKLWELSSGRELRSLTGHARSVKALAVTPDGQRAVSASYDKTLRVWDLESGRELCTLTGHSDTVTAVAVTPDGQRAVSASEEKTLKVWDLGSGHELRTLTGHSNWVTAVAVTPDGQCAISASWDKTLKVWELGSGRELRTLTGHSDSVRGVAVTPDGRNAVSASDDQTLKVWDIAGGCDLRASTGHEGPVNAVAVTPGGHRAVSASSDKTLKVWDLGTGRELRIHGHASDVPAVAVTPDGMCVVSASGARLRVWELGSGRTLRTFIGNMSPVTGVAVMPDGQRAVSASGKELKVWELESGCALRTLAGHSDSVNGVAVTPDGKRAVSASLDKTLKVWELDSGRELRTLAGHTDGVYGVAVTPDGKRAVSASYAKTLKVWELESGCELRTLEGHTSYVRGVATSGDGKRAVSASYDNTVKVWELDTGKVLATFTFDSAAYCCTYSDALNLIVAGDVGGHVHFLRLEEPKK